MNSFSIAFQPDGRKALDLSCVSIRLDAKFNRKRLPENFEAHINSSWEEQRARSPWLWNGTKFRYAGHEYDNDKNHLVVFLGITDYKAFLGTNCSPKCTVISQLGATDHDDTQAYMSDPVGVGALLLTSDDHVVLIKRSMKVGEEKGKLDLPGGHPEPMVSQFSFSQTECGKTHSI